MINPKIKNRIPNFKSFYMPEDNILKVGDLVKVHYTDPYYEINGKRKGLSEIIAIIPFHYGSRFRIRSLDLNDNRPETYTRLTLHGTR